MIIPKIVKVLQRLDESQKSTHKKLDAIQVGLQSLLRALGAQRTPAVRSKPVDCSSEELRVSMYDKSQVGLESAQEGIQLSSAIYSAFRSKNGLTKEQLSQIKNILENHKLLNDLTGESKAQSAKIEKALLMLNSKMSQVDKMYFEARAVMADHVKPKSKIFRPGVS